MMMEDGKGRKGSGDWTIVCSVTMVDAVTQTFSTEKKMVDATTQTGIAKTKRELTEPFIIRKKRTFAEFRELEKREGPNIHYEKVKMISASPFAMSMDAAPVIIVSRNLKEKGPLLHYFYQRYPEYKELTLKSENPMECEVIFIKESLVLVTETGDKGPQEDKYMFIVIADELEAANGALEKTYNSLMDLKEKVNRLRITKIAVACDLMYRLEYHRKMLEYIFRGEKVEVTFCILPLVQQNPEEDWQTDAIIIKCRRDTYDSLLFEVHEHLKDIDCIITKMESEKILILVEKGQGKYIQEIIRSRMRRGNVILKTNRERRENRQQTDAILICGYSVGVTFESLLFEVREHLKDIDQIITEVKKMKKRNLLLRVVKGQGKEIAKILVGKMSGYKIISTAHGEESDVYLPYKVKEVNKRIFCEKCWEPGHMHMICEGVNRSNLCPNCGEECHSEICRKPVFCPVCNSKRHRARTHPCLIAHQKLALKELEKQIINFPPETMQQNPEQWETDTIIISVDKKASYESLLFEVREHLKDVDCIIIAIQRMGLRKVSMLVEKGQGERIKEILSSKMSGHRIVKKDRYDGFCSKCWERGHIDMTCKGVDRRNLCQRCGEEGHSMDGCKNCKFCPVCNTRGHIARTPKCHKKAATQKKAKKPCGDPVSSGQPQ